MSSAAPTEVRLNSELILIHDNNSWQDCLAQTRAQEFAELWIKGEKEDSLAVLINRDQALLVYLRFPGDAGLSSRNPQYSGVSAEMVEFSLAGQREKFPALFAIDTDAALRAADHFYHHHKLADWICWHDDRNLFI